MVPGPWLRAYTYDLENRLVKAVAGGVTVNLTWDPLGRLWQVDKGTSDTTTKFLYDGDAMVAEMSDSGTITNRYVHGSNAAADDPLVWYVGSGLTSKRWLHADHLGSIVAATSTGTPGGSPSINSYDEYGIPGSGNVGRFQYTGQAWLPELGMYHYKARIYSPTLGRFLQTDPIGYDDQFNLYAYVANDPINKADPTGNESYLVARPTGYLGNDHMFVVVVNKLGDRPTAIFSFGPTGTPTKSLFGGSKLVSVSGTNTPTAVQDRAAAALLASPQRASMAGVSAVRIQASDRSVLAAGRAATAVLGTLKSPGNVTYSAYPGVFGGVNSNSAAYAVANFARAAEGANGNQPVPPGAGVPGAAQSNQIEKGMSKFWSVDGSKITGSRGCGSRISSQC